MPDSPPPRLSADRPLLLDDAPALADLVDVSRWPGLQLAYDYVGAPRAGERRLRLHLGVVLPATDADALQGGQQRWRGLARALARTDLCWSLACSLDGGVPHPIDPQPLQALAAEAAEVCAGRAAGREVPAPAACSVEVAVEPSNPLDLFALVVEFGVEHPLGPQPQANAAAGPAPRRASRSVPPRRAAGVVGQVPQLAEMAAAFEAAGAQAECVLKLARGHAPAGEPGAPPPLWVLRLCRQPQAAQPRGLRWQLHGTRSYAPAPLATHLLSRDAVSVPQFDGETGLDAAASASCTFTGLSLDALAQLALQGLDELLAPPLAEALTALGQQAGPLPCESPLQAIRRELAAAVAERLQPVIATDAADAAAGAPRAEAVSLLQQSLLSGVSRIATLGAACQVQVEVAGRLAAPAAGEGRPRLGACIVVTESQPAGEVPARPVAEALVHLPLQGEPAWFGLLLSPPDRTQRRHVRLDLRLQPVSIVWPGDDLPPAARGSRQLHLLRPDAGETQAPLLGSVDLPLPLREPPPAPTIAAQAASQRVLPPTGAAARLAASLAWDYRLEFAAPAAAQDIVQIALVAPVPGPSSTRLTASERAPGPDLLDHLAGWWQLWPQLQPALQAALEAWQARPADAAALQRARTLAANAVQLLAPLPSAWRAWQPLPPVLPVFPDLPPPRVTAELCEQRRPAGTEAVVTLCYQAKELEAWCLPPEPAAGPAALRLSASDGAAVDLPLQGPDGVPQDQVAALALPWRRLTLAGLSIVACPGLEARLRVQRNAVLLHDDAGRPLPTNPAFVFTTPVVSPASPCVPFVDHAQAVDVAALSTPSLQPLARHFERLFEALQLPVQASAAWPAIELSFARPAGAADFGARWPVLLLPPRASLPPGKPAAAGVPLPQALATAVQQWAARELPGEGMLELVITWYADAESASTPLARWRGLSLSTADVSDLPGATASRSASISSPPASGHPPG